MDLKPEERELVKLVQYFKKRAEKLIAENKLDDEYRQMLDTCDKLVEQLNMHAKNRSTVMAEREQLQSMIKDNAKCPKCNSNELLKVIGFDTNPQGWKSNKYKCRRCNIAFVWNTPNNPWDMIPYVENFIAEMEQKVANSDAADDPEIQVTVLALEQMKANLAKLKPVVDASDLDQKELQERETQMTDMVHKFKKHLMIEKIRIEE
jgi:DNA-directed RNA polymerase subunit RPC12/RpoP